MVHVLHDLYCPVGIKHPEMTSDMLAYMLHILRSHREYEEPAWREYDVRFRQLAAVLGNKAWAQLDPQLYNQCFVGRARRVASSPQPGEASAGITKPARAARARRNPRFASDSIGRDLAPTIRNAGVT